MTHLNREQQAGLNLVYKGHNICVTGGAGSGKSYLIRELAKKSGVKLTASTGVAANLIGGETIFSAFKLPWDTSKPCRAQPTLFKDVKILVIDEVSMLSAEVFEYLEQHARRSLGNDHFFGGLQVILVGDFYQLPPVKGQWIFTSSLWRHFKIIILNEVYRQEGKLLDTLRRIRVGEPQQADLTYIQGLSRPLPQGPIQPTQLSSYRSNVDKSNLDNLRKLNEPIYTFEGYATTATKSSTVWKQSSMSHILQLAKGAQVMYLINFNGLCNGSRGVVVDFTADHNLPVVQFKDTKITVHPHAVPVKDGKKRYELVQLPLCLAWALTIHKVQGQGLDYVNVNLQRGCFAAGQLYVALSRAKNEEGLCVRGFKPAYIIVDDKVTAFYLQAKRQQESLLRTALSAKRPSSSLSRDSKKPRLSSP